VDLLLGSATGTAGVSHVDNVTGSIGNDILVGNTKANVLKGGTGRNLIIGENGADQLFGGGGDSILIGGTTPYDADLTALSAIMKEWAQTDLSFSQRMSHIQKGGGLNGTDVLNAKTVSEDTTAKTFHDAAGLDWIFAHLASDTIKNKKSKDVITPV
jgi:Ca2+-binding RTX toxin-like protein